jgi:hypothetical protein
LGWDQIPSSWVIYLQLIGALMFLSFLSYCNIGGEAINAAIAMLLGALAGYFGAGRNQNGSKDAT